MSVFWIILGTLLSLNILWAWHADALLRRNRRSWKVRVWPPLFAVLMGGTLLLFVLGRGMDFPVREYLPGALVAALYLWHLVVLPVWLAVAPPTEIVLMLKRVVGRAAAAKAESGQRKEGDETAPVGGASLNRRRLLGSLVAAAAPVALIGATGISMRQVEQFRVRRLEVPLFGLPSALDGLTLSQVSDAHVGVFTGGPTLREIAETTNRLGSDLVMLTGDLINDDLADLPEAIEMVKSMRAKHGVFLCEGNHDLIPGPGEFTRECREAGLNLLVNEEHTLMIKGEALQVLGLRWGRGGRTRDRAADYAEDAISHSMGELLRQRRPEAFPILLAHHPHAFDEAVEAGLPLTLSGHTHGGQLMINEDFGFGPALYRYWSGLYESENSSLVVSNGAGNWFPLRTAAPAEILHLTLRGGGVKGETSFSTDGNGAACVARGGSPERWGFSAFLQLEIAVYCEFLIPFAVEHRISVFF